MRRSTVAAAATVLNCRWGNTVVHLVKAITPRRSWKTAMSHNESETWKAIGGMVIVCALVIAAAMDLK
jgi:hypothetical protein